MNKHPRALVQLFSLAVLLLVSTAAAAEIQKFVYVYDDGGTLLSPLNAASACPDPMTDEPATTCQGVLVNEAGQYSLELNSDDITSPDSLVLVAHSYEFIAAGSEPGVTQDTYIKLRTKRRLQNVTVNADNDGADINALSEATVQAVEEEYDTALGTAQEDKSSTTVPDDVDVATLNEALGNDTDDNSPQTTDDQNLYGLLDANQRSLDETELDTLTELALLAVQELNDSRIVNIIRKNTLQALLDPATMDEAVDRILTQTSVLTNGNETTPAVVLEADRYVVHVDEVVNLDTGGSINPARFFGYTWLGVDSDVTSATFSSSEPGSYLICVTGEADNPDESSSDCIRIQVKDFAYAVITPSDIRIPTGQDLYLSAFFSVGAESYAWSGEGSFATPNAVDTLWTAPSTEGRYALTLTLNGDTSESISIDVYDVLPVAIATADRHLVFLDDGDSDINLTSSSIATNGSAVDAIAWSVVEQPANSTPLFGNAAAPFTTFTSDEPGLYIVRLTATKNGHNDHVDLSLDLRLHGVPVADAGPDRETFRNIAVNLDGSDSADPDGLPLNHHWTGNGGSFGSATSASTTFTANTLGSYTATLTVSNGVNSASDETIVTVRNRLPLASDDIFGAVLGEVAAGYLHAFDNDGDTLNFELVTDPLNGGVTIDPLLGEFVYVPGGQKGCHYHPYSTPFDNEEGGKDVPVIKLCADKFVTAVGEPITLTTSNSINASKFSGYTWIGVESDTTTATFIGDEAGVYNICIRGHVGQSNNTSTACVDLTVKAVVLPSDNPTVVDEGFVDSFQFAVHDGFGQSNIATVALSIGWENTPPDVDDLTLTTDEDTAVSGTITGSDVDGQLMVYSVSENGALGTLVFTDAAAGEFTYTPNANAFGTDTILITATDGHDDSAPATVTVTITPVDDEPVANDASYTMNEDTALNDTLSAEDVDGDALSYTLVSNGGIGTAAITDATTGAFVYTPAANARGNDSFTFMVNDGTQNSNVATVSITVANVNDSPLAHDLDRIFTPEDTAFSATLDGEDIDGDTLTYRLVTSGDLGTAVLDDATTGAFTYTPTPDVNGSESIAYVVNDGTEDSIFALVPITIEPVNDAPVVDTTTSIATDEDNAVSATVTMSDVDDDPLTLSIVSNAALGTAVIDNAATGAFTYTPDPDAFGTDSFTVRANDGQLNSALGTVVITINPIDDAPLAADLHFYVDKTVTLQSALEGSDVDGDTLTYSILGSPNLGNVQLLNIVTGAFSYTPNGTVGSDSFTYRVNDGQGDSNTATVTLDVTEFNNAPTATGRSIEVFQDVPYVNLVSGSDADGDPISFAIDGDGTLGSASFNDAASGEFTYTPGPGQAGSDLFTFTVSDGRKVSAPGLVFANIIPTAVACAGPQAPGHDDDGDGYANLVELAFGTAIDDAAQTPFGLNPDDFGISFTDDDDGDTFADHVEVWLGSDPLDDTSIPTDSLNKLLPACVSDGADQFPPALMAFDILTPVVNMDLGDTAARFALTAADNIGVKTVSVLLRSPAGQEVTGTVSQTETSVMRYVEFDSEPFGFYAEAGIWLVAELDITDAAGNRMLMTTQDLLDRELPTEVQVINANSDIAPPDLLAFTILTPSVDLSLPDPLASFDVTATDNVAGVSRITVTLTSPSGRQFRWGELNNAAHPLTLSGQIDTQPFDVYAESGTWVVTDVTLVDHAGMSRGYATADLITAGFDTTVEVFNSQIDTVAPTLDDFVILTPYVYLINPSPLAQYSVTVSDDKSGVHSVEVALQSPSGAVIKLAGLTSVENPLSLTAMLESELFTLADEPGVWTVTTVNLGDAAGNAALYTTADLIAAGYDTTVFVYSAWGWGYNTPPVAYPSAIETDEDTPYTGTLNAFDADGHELNHTLVAAASNGTVAIDDASTGAFTYTPAANYHGSDSFSFQVDDGYSVSNVAIVTVTVHPVNDAPTVEDMDIVVIQDQVYVGGLIGSDVDGDPITFAVAGNGSLGLAEITDVSTGVFSYTPDTGVLGQDSFTVEASDGTLTSEPATVSVTIRPDMAVLDFNVLTPVVNANEAFVTLSAEVTLSKPIADLEEVRVNLDGPSGQLIGFATAVNPSDSYPIVLSKTVSPTTENLEVGLWAFSTLAARQVGKFTVTVQEDLAAFDPQVQVIDNTAPIAFDASDATEVGRILSGTLSATDSDGDPLTFRIVGNGVNGTATVTDDSAGAFEYLATLAGGDSFSFVANDGYGDSNIATVSLTVDPANGTPNAYDQTVTVIKNVPYFGTLPANDPEGSPLTYTLLSGTGNGTVELLDGNTGSFGYTPLANFTGSDSFTFKVNDGNSDSNTATITLSVVNSDGVPLAYNDAITVFENVAYGGVLPGVDPDGDSLSYQITSTPALGMVEWNADTGAYTYTPGDNTLGNDSFSYTVSDGNHVSAAGLISVTIISTEQACQFDDDAPAIDSDEDGYADPLEIAFGTDPDNPLETPEGLDATELGVLFTDDDDSDNFVDYAEIWLTSDPADADSVPTLSTLFGLPECFDPNSDGIKPRLLGLNVATPVVDVSDTDPVARFILTLADNASGLRRARVDLISPAGAFITASASFDDYPLVRAVAIETAPFSPYAEEGVWQISAVTLYDEAGNKRTVDSDELADAGFANSIELSNLNGDATAPALDNLSVLTPVVDALPGNGVMSFDVTASDAIAGVQSILISVTSPSGVVVEGAAAFSDTPTTTTVQIDTPALSSYAEDGTWTITSVLISDAAGNSEQYADQLAGQGFPTTVSVINTGGDNAAPTLSSFSVLSQEVYPASGDARMSFAVSALDDVSGIEKIRIDLQGPAGQYLAAWGYFFASAPLSVNTQIDTAVLSTLLQEGTWTVTAIEVFDQAGNSSVTETQQLLDQGSSVTANVRY